MHSERFWHQFSYASQSLRRGIVRQIEAADLPPAAQVLDFGCADRPYRDCLPATANYIGADLPGNDQADIAISADGQVPLPDGSCELVLSTQVLEHVPEPDAYLTECRRLVKDSGRLLLTTHGVMYYHRDPEDYWRWSAAGIERQLGNAGFRVESIMGVLGMTAAAVQIFQDGTCWRLPRGLRQVYIAIMQLMVRGFDARYDPELRNSNCWTMVVLATPAGGAADGP